MVLNVDFFRQASYIKKRAFVANPGNNLEGKK